MKVKQIVSEHKKGVKAKIYAKKPKPLIGAEAQKKSEEKRKAEQAKKKQTPITQQPPSKQPANLSEDPNMQAGQTLGTVSKVDQTTGKVTYKTPDGQEQTTDPQQLTPTGTNNQLGMKVAPATPGQQIVAVKEEPAGNDPQMAGLQQLLMTEKEPWKQALTKWRIENLKDTRDIKGTTPMTGSGQLKPIVDSETWIKQNPSLVSSLPSEALPPTMQKPGMLDRMKQLINYK